MQSQFVSSSVENSDDDNESRGRHPRRVEDVDVVIVFGFQYEVGANRAVTNGR